MPKILTLFGRSLILEEKKYLYSKLCFVIKQKETSIWESRYPWRKRTYTDDVRYIKWSGCNRSLFHSDSTLCVLSDASQGSLSVGISNTTHIYSTLYTLRFIRENIETKRVTSITLSVMVAVKFGSDLENSLNWNQSEASVQTMHVCDHQGIATSVKKISYFGSMLPISQLG